MMFGFGLSHCFVDLFNCQSKHLIPARQCSVIVSIAQQARLTESQRYARWFESVFEPAQKELPTSDELKNPPVPKCQDKMIHVTIRSTLNETNASRHKTCIHNITHAICLKQARFCMACQSTMRQSKPMALEANITIIISIIKSY